MSHYFDRVEQGLRDAVRRGTHEPWYLRLRPQLSRPVVVAVACLMICGSALAATGVFRTGAPIGDEIAPTPDTNEGTVITSTAQLLPVRVPDPRGGPPWGLRILKTTRGLMCLQPGRVVNNRLGAIGEDGAFGDDHAFHPLSIGFLSGDGCATEDARGNAFLNEELYGLPANALPIAQHVSPEGCYARPHRRSNTCPDSDRRDIYYGLLGPDATTITYATPSGQLATVPTSGGDGAYLIVLPHSRERCAPPEIFCTRGENADIDVGPELGPSRVIRAVAYTNAPPCRLPSLAQAAAQRAANESKMPARPRTSLLHVEERRPRCPAVGYVAIRSHPRLTPAQIASPVIAHAEPAKHYCEGERDLRPCDGPIPKGYKRLTMRTTPPQLLLVIDFTARFPITNFDSHYEINTTNLHPDTNCPAGEGAATFGPTNTNLRGGRHVRYTLLVNPRCRGLLHITVGLVTVNGPSGDTPVPGLPGQSAEIPVGQTDFRVP